MLGSFKIRMLLVIFIVALVGLSIQSEHSSKKIIEPVIKYILKDYGVEKNISAFVKNVRQSEDERVIPTTGKSMLQVPCNFLEIERKYGWYWNPKKKQQQFSPGVRLRVKENTIVRPVLEGQVMEISRNNEGRTVLIKHNGDFYSFYGGLKEVLVDKNAAAHMDSVIGKTSSSLQFEIRNQDGPLNPQKLFE